MKNLPRGVHSPVNRDGQKLTIKFFAAITGVNHCAIQDNVTMFRKLIG